MNSKQSKQQVNNIQEYVANAIIEHLKTRDVNYARFKEITDDLIGESTDKSGYGSDRSYRKYRKCNGCDYILKYGEDYMQECNDCHNLKIYCEECSFSKDIGELYVPDTEKERWLCRECINFIEKNEETVRNLIDKKVCTSNLYYTELEKFYSSKSLFVKQTYRRCMTCGHSDENGKGICMSCVNNNCHKGHELSNELEADFICDCTCKKFK
jgi:hypothetical protein